MKDEDIAMNSRPMSNIDKRALREAAEKATPGEWWIDSHGMAMVAHHNDNTMIVFVTDGEQMGKAIRHEDTGNLSHWRNDNDASFIAAANPATVLALLDELEAKDKSISFLKDQLAQLANFNPDWDKLEAATDSLREHMAKLSSAEKRIELLTLELNVLKGGCE
ncbi:ead/Ea22-like family protein [Enterobacter roggenkampii]